MIEDSASQVYIGLMSGTSLDGIDVAIADFSEFPPRLLHGSTIAYPPSTRQDLRGLCRAEQVSLDDLYVLDAQLGELYADAVSQALGQCALERKDIRALGCHGQTIRHSPDSATPYTVQIGDPNRLAVLSGITTVADFRRKDIALGGQAAPLAPAFHRYLFSSEEENRAVINIGGIANITGLPADPEASVIGFDTGPGNTLLDYWIEKHRGQAYDEGGDWARCGQVIKALLDEMLSGEAYFRADAPKSTGTGYFGPDWLNGFLRRELDARDVQATLAELTAASIAAAIEGLPQTPAGCFVCGGGAHNRDLLERLQRRLPDVKIQTTAMLDLSPDYVEATAFAWLARERLEQRGGNVPAVTQASRATVLGGVYLAD